MTASTAAEATRLDAAKREIKMVPVSKMFVDTRYQRALRGKRAQEFADNFSWDAFGLPCLSEREDGFFAEVDGQHRIESLLLQGLGNIEVEAEVFHGLSLSEEAALFRARNHMEKVPLLDKFRARLVEGEPTAVEMMKILDRNKWKLYSGNADAGYFAAVGKLELVYKLSPLAADRAISTLTRAWGNGAITVDGRLVEGMGRVFHRFNEQVDVDNLVDRLATFPGGAAAFLGQARGYQAVIGGTVGRAVGEKIIDVYNMRRKRTALPSLRTPAKFSVEDLPEESPNGTSEN